MSGIVITLDGVNYSLPPEAIVRDLEVNDKPMCRLGIALRPVNDNLSKIIFLGDPFLQNFAMEISYTSDEISFGLNKNALNGTSIDANPSFWVAYSWIKIVGIVLASLVVLMVILACSKDCLKKCGERR